MIALSTSDQKATDGRIMIVVKCENCKYWHQDGRDLKDYGSCVALENADEISFYVPGSRNVENVTTHKDFGCALFEKK